MEECVSLSRTDLEIFRQGGGGLKNEGLARARGVEKI